MGSSEEGVVEPFVQPPGSDDGGDTRVEEIADAVIDPLDHFSSAAPRDLRRPPANPPGLVYQPSDEPWERGMDGMGPEEGLEAVRSPSIARAGWAGVEGALPNGSGPSVSPVRVMTPVQGFRGGPPSPAQLLAGAGVPDRPGAPPHRERGMTPPTATESGVGAARGGKRSSSGRASRETNARTSESSPSVRVSESSSVEGANSKRPALAAKVNKLSAMKNWDNVLGAVNPELQPRRVQASKRESSRSNLGVKEGPLADRKAKQLWQRAKRASTDTSRSRDSVPGAQGDQSAISRGVELLARKEKIETMAEMKKREQAELRQRLNRRMDAGLEMQAEFTSASNFSVGTAARRFISRITVGANMDSVAEVERQANQALEMLRLEGDEGDSDDSDDEAGIGTNRTGEPSGRASDNTSPSKASQKSPGVKRIAFAGPSPPDSPRDSGDASPTKDGSRRSSLFSVDDDHPMVKVLRTINTKRWTGRVRYLAVRIISSPDFELLVILLIFGNCISLSMLRPQEGEDSVWNQRLNTVELVLNACFTVEVILRIVAIGGVFRFLSFPWNVFDAAMVSVGYTQFLPTTGGGADSFRALRAIRALRPLRTITRFKSLRSVVVCFMEAIPLLASVATLLIFFLFLFGIAGVQVFGEVYHYACQDADTGYVEEGPNLADSLGCGDRKCPTDTEYNYSCAFFTEGTQVNVAGFDNIGTSMLTVFQVTTLSNWSYILYRTMDASGGLAVFYYLITVLLGTYYIINLFLAVLKTKFGKAQDLFASSEEETQTPVKHRNTAFKMYHSARSSFHVVKSRFSRMPSREDDMLLDLPAAGEDSSMAGGESGDGTLNTERSVHTKSFAAYNRYQRPIRRPQQWWKLPKYWWKQAQRRLCWFVQLKYFNNFFLALILVNTILLAIEYDGMPDTLSEFLSTTNMVLTQLFTLEVVLKLMGLGIARYFSDGFNIFDLIVVIISQVEIILVNAQKSKMSGLRSLKTLRVLKSFRVLRVFKMFRYLDSLRKIGEVLINSMSSFVSIGLLTLLFNIVFSIMGLHMYGQYTPDIGYPNFHTFLDSCVLVFQVLTLEDWDLIAYSYIRETNYTTILFFIAWIVVGKYIFLTLFLAVTLEAFESKYDMDDLKEIQQAMEGSSSSDEDSDDDDDELNDDGGEIQAAGRGHSSALEEAGETGSGGNQALDQGASLPWAGAIEAKKTEPAVEVWRRSVDGGSEDGSDDAAVVPLPVIVDGNTEVLTLDGDAPGGRSNHLPWGTGSTQTAGAIAEATEHGGPSRGSHYPPHDSPFDLERSQNAKGGWKSNKVRPVAESTGDGESDALLPPREPKRRSIEERAAAREQRRSEEARLPFEEREARRAERAARRSEDRERRRSQEALLSPEERASLERRRAERRSIDESEGHHHHHHHHHHHDAKLEAEMKEAAALMGEDSNGEEVELTKEEREAARLQADYPPLEGRALLLFGPDNVMRARMYQVATSKTFEYIMFAFIVLSCVAMIYEHPAIEPGSTEDSVLWWIEIVLTSVFGVEVVLKVVAFGFLPYIRRVTNIIDFAIVVTSVLLLALESVADDIAFIKGLRVLRAAKPLRTLTRSKGMMLVFKSLSMSLMSMANVSIIVLLFFAIFAILGVQLFGGDFYYCTQDRTIDGTPVLTRDDCAGLGMDGEPLEWVNNYLNFDHLGNAFMTLFVTVTLDGYSDVMKLGMSVRGKDLQPLQGANAGGFLYFAIFIMVCSFCLLNLYVGVVFYQFSRIRLLSHAGSAFLTNGQQEWCELSKMVFRLRPLDKVIVPPGDMRKWCHFFVLNPKFDNFMTFVIVLNVGFMSVEHFGMNQAFQDASRISNYIFTAIFVVEAVLKVVGLTWRVYWKNGWNKFDLFVVIASLFDLIVSFLESQFLKVLRVFRVQKLLRLLRISRMIKLVKGLKGVRSLFSTLILSLPAFWNVGALLMLLFFIYAYVGVLLFGEVRLGEGLNHNANFTRFWYGLNVLLRMATNDDWYLIMKDCSVSPPDCSREVGNCGSPVAQWYFSSFVGFVSIIMLNLFTAVIIENFEKQQEQESWKIMPTALDEFRELWAEYDDGSGTITPRDLHDLLTRLSPPLGLGPTTTNAELLRFVAGLNIPLEAGRVPFQRTAFELVRRVSETEIPEGNMKAGLDRMVSTAFASSPEDDLMSFNVAMIVLRIQRKWRATVRSNKVKNRLAIRAARCTDMPSLSELLLNKPRLVAEVQAFSMDGKPWAIDPARGLGALSDWAFVRTTQTGLGAGIGLGARRMTAALGGLFGRRNTNAPTTPKGSIAAGPSGIFGWTSGTPKPKSEDGREPPTPTSTMGASIGNFVRRMTRVPGQLMSAAGSRMTNGTAIGILLAEDGSGEDENGGQRSRHGTNVSQTLEAMAEEALRGLDDFNDDEEEESSDEDEVGGENPTERRGSSGFSGGATRSGGIFRRQGSAKSNSANGLGSDAGSGLFKRAGSKKSTSVDGSASSVGSMRRASGKKNEAVKPKRSSRASRGSTESVDGRPTRASKDSNVRREGGGVRADTAAAYGGSAPEPKSFTGAHWA